jgi:regulator of protease activity HflC (stomatin/prohibitin superfamily)
VFDPKLFAYGIEKPIQGIENLAATNLRSVVGEMELDQTLSGREVINGKMQVALDEATDPWGIKVIRVEIKNIQPPEEIEAVMTKQMRAERERRETILQAEAHQESIVKRAEGDKRAKVLAAEAERDAQIAIAEGKARSVELVYEAESKGLEMLKDANVSETVLKLKGIDALKVIADGRATKIFMPNNLSDMISSLGIVAESMGVGDHTPIDKSPKPKEKKPADPCLDEESNEITKNAAVVTDAMESDVETTYQNMTL